METKTGFGFALMCAETRRFRHTHAGVKIAECGVPKVRLSGSALAPLVSHGLHHCIPLFQKSEVSERVRLFG
jgi:hypothetical protein